MTITEVYPQKFFYHHTFIIINIMILFQLNLWRENLEILNLNLNMITKKVYAVFESICM